MLQVTGLLFATLAVWLGNASLQQGTGEEVVVVVVWLTERQTTEARMRRSSQDNLIVAGLDTILCVSLYPGGILSFRKIRNRGGRKKKIMEFSSQSGAKREDIFHS